ncbi:hypothetical protein MMC29_004889 [Sticta canariensis]|nr:hypothetical protein [Sticta canariensis]
MAAHHKRRNPSDIPFSHFLQHSTSSRPEIAAWIRRLSTLSESTDPAAPPTPPAKRRRVLRELHSNPQSRHPHCAKHQHADTNSMGGSPKKDEAQRPSATGDDDSRLTRSRTRKSERAGSISVVSTRERIVAIQENDANTLPLTEEPVSTSATSEYDAISEAASFPPPTWTSSQGRSPTRSSSPKKKTVVKREDLALLNPTIKFRAFSKAENLGIALPQSARRNTPPGAHLPIPLTSKDLMRIEVTLEDAFEKAERWRTTTTEPHWISVVVGPILHLIENLSAFRGKDMNSNENITVMDITPIEISPTHLCPYSSTSIYRDLDKRIDYAIGLYPSDSTLKKLEKATYNTVTKSVNQTSTFCSFIPMFVNVEVKKRHVATDPAIQLGAWIAAEFRKRLIEGWTDMGFEDMQKNSLSLGSPVFAIEIEADNWLLYVVIAQLEPPKSHKLSKQVTKEDAGVNATEQDFEMFFFGPMMLGNTYSMDDMKRLVENLCDISLWGQTEFKKWWEKTVVAACEE